MPVKPAPCLRSEDPRPPGAPERDLRHAQPRLQALTGLVHRPWLLRVDGTTLIVRRASPRDLPAVAAMHARCSAASLLDRYHNGGRPPAVVALELRLRQALSFVVTTREGVVVATADAAPDHAHAGPTAVVGMLVSDEWQRHGIGRELIRHVAGGAAVCGYGELIAYTGTSSTAAQRLLLGIGTTRLVLDPTRPHLHTYLPETAGLGLAAVRERLAS